jgi:putative salt-induced outer membrane protein YdiY
MFEHETYDLPADAIHPDDVSVHRWSNYLSVYWQIRTELQLGGVIYFQPRFDDFSDYRALSEQNLTIALADFLALTVNFKIRYDSDPADTVLHTDTATDFGIAVSF